MKVSGAVLSLLIIAAALCYQAHASPSGLNTPRVCCFNFADKRFPSKLVADYKTTDSQCSKKGVVLISKRGREICANPEEQWVQDIIKHLDNQKAKLRNP
ncbi:C-C motif chemokine 3-like [Macrotis lagotis]|uniref:C-C motif chemokine 3-like n=1 Tax=Macrotis lagotis TaxID=92651 RepID=UPI003D69D467